MNTQPREIMPPLRSDRYEDEIDLRAYLRLLRRRFWIILLVSLICGAIGAAVNLLTPRVYEATAGLMVRADPPDFPVAAAMILKYQALFDELELVQRVMDETGLRNASPSITADKLRAALSTRFGPPNLIFVDVRWPDAQLAARVAITAAQSAVALAQRREQNETTSLREVRRAEVERADRLLAAAADALMAGRRGANFSVGPPYLSGLPELLADIAFESERIRAAQEQLAKTSPMVRVRHSLNTERETVDEVPNQAYETLTGEVALARAKLAGLEAKRAYLSEVEKGGASTRLARLTAEFQRAQRLRDQIADSNDLEMIRPSTAIHLRLEVVNDVPMSTHVVARQSVATATALGLSAGLLLSIMGVMFVATVRE